MARRGTKRTAPTPNPTVPNKIRQHQSLKVDPIQFLVLDEADRLMDLGFEKDIAKICDYVKTKRDDFLLSNGARRGLGWRV